MGYYVYKGGGQNFGGCMACGGLGDSLFDTMFPMADEAMKALEAQYQATLPVAQAAAEAAKASALKQVEDTAAKGATSSVMGLLLAVGAVGAGLWLLFSKKKRKTRRNVSPISRGSYRGYYESDVGPAAAAVDSRRRYLASLTPAERRAYLAMLRRTRPTPSRRRRRPRRRR